MSDQQTVPPPPPVPPGPVEEPANEPLVRRVERLEDGQLDTRERLARLETRLEDIAAQMATKADIATLRTEMATIRTEMAIIRTEIGASAMSLLKWMIGTAVALASLAFAAGHFIR